MAALSHASVNKNRQQSSPEKKPCPMLPLSNLSEVNSRMAFRWRTILPGPVRTHAAAMARSGSDGVSVPNLFSDGEPAEHAHMRADGAYRATADHTAWKRPKR